MQTSTRAGPSAAHGPPIGLSAQPGWCVDCVDRGEIGANDAVWPVRIDRRAGVGAATRQADVGRAAEASRIEMVPRGPLVRPTWLQRKRSFELIRSSFLLLEELPPSSAACPRLRERLAPTLVCKGMSCLQTGTEAPSRGSPAT